MAINSTDSRLSDVLDSLDQKILLLRNEYEQFFLGFVKKEPTDKRAEVDALIQRLSRERINNTALKFRFQQLRARFATFSLRWTRTLKQIEDGTYRRDLFRVKLRDQDTSSQSPEQQQASKQEDEVRKRPEIPSIQDTVLDEGLLKKVYQDFINIRQRCRERTDNVHFDKMVDFMKQQTQSIKKQYDCKAVHFEVVEDGGKAKLRAIPVRKG